MPTTFAPAGSKAPPPTRPIARLAAALFVFCLAAPAWAQNGTVTGTVTNEATAAPVTSGSVTFCTVSSSCTNVGLNSSGTYTASLAPGTYYAFTQLASTSGLINEIFDNVKCTGPCSSNTAAFSGTAIIVTSGSAQTRSFALTPGGTIAGTVTDTAGAPLQGVPVRVFAAGLGEPIAAGQASTDVAGAYSIGGLPTGTYYAFTNVSTFSVSGTPQNVVNEIYNDIFCAGVCNVLSGDEISVTIGATTPGINFALSTGGRITGKVVDSLTQTPIPGVQVVVAARFGLGISNVASGTTTATGDYAINGLPTGSYFVYTNTGNAINEIYNDITCPGSCPFGEFLAQGQPVTVTQGGTTPGVDFGLDPGGTFSGQVVAAGSLAPLSGSLTIYRQVGTFLIFSRATVTSGTFTARGLPTGTYFAAAFVNDYVPKVYGGTDCFPCASSVILSGAPISVTAGGNTPGVDFLVDRLATISGTLTNAATGAGLPEQSVQLYRAGSSSAVAFATTNAAGTFTFPFISGGTYYVATNTGQYANKVYNNVPCPGGFCSSAFAIANGTPVPVSAGATAANVDVALSPLSQPPGPPSSFVARITSSGLETFWTAPTSGGVATSYVLEGGVTPGGTLASLPTNATSLVVPGVPPGTFYLRVRGVNLFGTGASSSEVIVVSGGVATVAPAPPAGFVAWTAGNRLTVSWNAPFGSPAPGDYVLEAGTAAGLANIASIPIAGKRAFTFEPVPPGFYFLRVRSRVGGLLSAPSTEVMINVGNVPAPPSPPQTFTHTVSGSTVTFTWTAPLVGTPTSYTFEAGSSSGLSNIAVFNTGSAATTFSVPGVPRGTYYLRLRAANALGTSPASNERVVVVQ
jgi:Carboxypeptidase regulatory-like domain